MKSNKDAAIALAGERLTVFPCGPDKKPRGPWKDVPVRSLGQISILWNNDDLPAIPVGKHGMVVLDCDVKLNGPDGRTAFHELCKLEGIDLSNAFVVTTPSGGLHFYFTAAEPFSNSSGSLPAGIDVRGKGGYVIGPGAVLPDGRMYRHDHGAWDTIPELPEALARYLRSKDASVAPLGAPTEVSGTPTAPPLPESVSAVTERDRVYAERALEAEVSKLSALGPGDRRNSALNEACFVLGTLAGNGSIEPQRVGEQLYAASVTNGHVAKHGHDQTVATIESGIRAGMSKPRPLQSNAPDIDTSGLLTQGKQANQATGKRGIEIMRGTNIEEQPITWLWHGWLPKGKLTLLAGAGGTGKSTIAFSLAATVSNGGNWPDGKLCNEQGNVLIWSSEDDPADTIKPRLMAMSADHQRIGVITGAINEKGQREAFDPSRDMDNLREAVNKIGGVKLFIIDPIVTAVTGDMNKANDVRRALQPIVDFAAEMDCAVLGITHFAKNTQGKRSDERVIGSVAFKDFARMVLTAAKDEETNLRAFTRPKSNISVDEGGFFYTIEPVMVTDRIEATRIKWGEFIQGSARSILADIEGDDTQPMHKPKRQGPREHAKDFIRDTLTRGPLPIQLVKDMAMKSGHAPATLQRAVAGMGLITIRDEVTKQMLWQLPSESVTAQLVAKFEASRG